eukprot:Hpha_TRINITY_DN30352_c0_g1::TRINITY_DN30352_c0_g1_i1::g.147143::m.147143
MDTKVTVEFHGKSVMRRVQLDFSAGWTSLRDIFTAAAQECGIETWQPEARVEASEDGLVWSATSLSHSADEVVRLFRQSHLRVLLPGARVTDIPPTTRLGLPAGWRGWIGNVIRFVLPAVVMFVVTLKLLGHSESDTSIVASSVRSTAASKGVEATAGLILSAVPPAETHAARRAVAKFLSEAS